MYERPILKKLISVNVPLTEILIFFVNQLSKLLLFSVVIHGYKDKGPDDNGFLPENAARKRNVPNPVLQRIICGSRR
jgi:hypothetical protein